MKPDLQLNIPIPSPLLEQGLTAAQLETVARQGFIVACFKQGYLTAAQAAAQLSITEAELLALLDSLEVLYTLPPPAAGQLPRLSPHLAHCQDIEQQLTAAKNTLSQVRQELATVKQSLARADRVRSDFVATVSHELRTPLNSILGFTKLLLKQQIGPLNPTQQTDLSLIYDSAQHLLSLVNNILDLSKIDAGKIRLDFAPTSVEEIIVGLIASTYILIEDKPIELIEEIQHPLPTVYVDRERIRQVVINLLSNAAKFTDRGTITLRVKSIIQNDAEYICISVQDTGIGINPADLDKVFEPFRQIDSSDGRRAEGTGLGMPISARLIKLHGGNLWVESELNRGSTFFFTLPVKPPQTIQNNTVHADYRLS